MKKDLYSPELILVLNFDVVANDDPRNWNLIFELMHLFEVVKKPQLQNLTIFSS